MHSTLVTLTALIAWTLSVLGMPPADAAGRTDYVLAVNWQPGFCETRPRKPECRSQHRDRLDASHFSLHGLWPQPRSKVYCKVSEALRQRDRSGKWASLPALELQKSTRTEMNRAMPGAASHLHRHEWVKHGTCYHGKTAEEYIADSLLVLRTLNGSAVRTLFANNIGATISGAQIRAAFDEAFGAGAGDRVRVSCKQDGRRRIITELTIGLSGDIAPGASLAELIRAARPTKNRGCPSGIVDPVGLQ